MHNYVDNVDNYHKALILLDFRMCIKLKIEIGVFAAVQLKTVMIFIKKQRDYAEEVNIILLFPAVLLSEEVFADVYNITGTHSDYKVTACTVF